MRVFLLRSAAAGWVLAALLVMLSCAHDQQLVSIEVQPTTENFGAADPSLGPVQLIAYGHYIHPPVTKDITNQVLWSSNTPTVAMVTSTGALSPGGVDCGNSLVTATVKTNSSNGGRSSSGALISGSMTANVTCASGTGGAGGGGGGGGGGGSGSNFVITVQFSGTGSGTISSFPIGLGCASQCASPFPAGINVTLTASPNAGSTFGGWVGCDTTVGLACSILLNNNRVVAVTFN